MNPLCKLPGQAPGRRPSDLGPRLSISARAPTKGNVRAPGGAALPFGAEAFLTQIEVVRKVPRQKRSRATETAAPLTEIKLDPTRANLHKEVKGGPPFRFGWPLNDNRGSPADSRLNDSHKMSVRGRLTIRIVRRGNPQARRASAAQPSAQAALDLGARHVKKVRDAMIERNCGSTTSAERHRETTPIIADLKKNKAPSPRSLGKRSSERLF